VRVEGETDAKIAGNALITSIATVPLEELVPSVTVKLAAYPWAGRLSPGPHLKLLVEGDMPLVVKVAPRSLQLTHDNVSCPGGLLGSVAVTLNSSTSVTITV